MDKLTKEDYEYGFALLGASDVMKEQAARIAQLETALAAAQEALELAPEPPDPENFDEIESFESDYADWYAQRRNTALAAGK